MPEHSKPLFFSVVLILGIMLFSLFTPNSYAAVGSPQTASLTSLDKNQNINVILGNYSIFATDKTLFFYYTTTGILAKTWSDFYGEGSQQHFKTNIIKLNATHIFVANIYDVNMSPWRVGAKVYLLKIDTLGSTKIFETLTPQHTQPYAPTSKDLVLINQNGVFYLIAAHKNSFDYAIYASLFKFYPSYSSLGEKIGTFLVSNPSIYIPSKSDNDVIYVLTNYGTKCAIYKVTLSTYTVFYIGETGYVNSYSANYVYLVDWIYHNVGGTYYYDVFIVFNDDAATQTGGAVIIRFNDGYLSEGIALKYIELWEGGEDGMLVDSYFISLSNIVRFMSCSLPIDSYGNGTLQNGLYRLLYSTKNPEKNYPLAIFAVEIVNLTQTSNWNINKNTNPPPSGINPQYYPLFISPSTFYFSGSTNVGGLMNPYSNVILYVDYANDLIISDLINSLNANFSFVYSLTPNAIDKGINFIDLYLNQRYVFNGYVYYNGIQAGNGNFTIYTTGLGMSSSVTSLGTYLLKNTGVIINGIVTFALEARTSALSEVYEGLRVAIQLNSSSATYTYLLTWKENPANPNPGGGNMGYGGFDLTWFLVIFLCVVLPSMVFGFALGKPGFLGGLVLSSGICIATGLLPFWIIPFIGLTMLVSFLMWKQ